jgi:O-antigen/teichoic acid export membrane protein
LFGYSSSIFLVGIANQLAAMSQAIIVGKVLGIGAVAAFVVSSKSNSVILQIMSKALDAYYPRWMQMYVGGKQEQVCQQWRSVMYWLLPISLIGALGILILNRSFALLYGGAGNHVGRWFDLALACSLPVQLFVQSMYFVFPLSSRVRDWSAISLSDAMLQILLGALLTRWLGPSGLILGGILGTCCVSVPFMILRAPVRLGVSRRAMLGGFANYYLAGGILLAACFALLQNAHEASEQQWWPSWLEWILGTTMLVAAGAMLWRRFKGTPAALPTEIM